MLDLILSPFLKGEDETCSAGTLADNVRSYLAVPERTESMLVYLPSWHGKASHIKRVGACVINKGEAFLTYEFPGGIISSDAETTRNHFTEIKDNVREHIDEIRDIHRIREIRVAGLGLGCFNAAMVANQNPLVNEAILIAPGSCLAESLWYGCRAKHLREEFEKKGITLDELKEEWKELALENNLDLGNAKSKVFLSRDDKVIPYSNGAKLVRAMDERGLKPRVIENSWLGHYGTMVQFYLAPKRFLY
jgi:pimeloyl-ACP methyl ester carboxylesterase